MSASALRDRKGVGHAELGEEQDQGHAVHRQLRVAVAAQVLGHRSGRVLEQRELRGLAAVEVDAWSRNPDVCIEGRRKFLIRWFLECLKVVRSVS